MIIFIFFFRCNAQILQILSSNKFVELISELKSAYDYVIIDSAPTLLVSDSFEISKFADTTLYIVKSGSVENNIASHINECHSQGKLNEKLFELCRK